MRPLLEKMRQLTRMLQASAGQVDFDRMARALAECIKCDAYLADCEGRVLARALSDDPHRPGARGDAPATTTIIPVTGGDERLGTLVLARTGAEFDVEDLVVGEFGAAVLGLQLLRARALTAREDARRRAAAKAAVDSLSYSELEAMPHVIAQLKGRAGLLVTSNVAGRLGVSRSVIVNALAKWKSAGVVYSRNVGSRGTFVKILNEQVVVELRRRQGERVAAAPRERVEATAADWSGPDPNALIGWR